MTFIQLVANCFVFFIGVVGIVRNRSDIVIILMSIELVLLSVNLNYISFSVYLDDIFGQVFSLLILAVGASEAAVGLAIIILYYRIRGDITYPHSPSLKN
jgi:NADH-quinone oxidoreductase subunit K